MKQTKLDTAKMVKDWQDGNRTQTSVVDEMVAAGYSVAQISRTIDRPYRQVFNTANRKRYGGRPSERGK